MRKCLACKRAQKAYNLSQQHCFLYRRVAALSGAKKSPIRQAVACVKGAWQPQKVTHMARKHAIHTTHPAVIMNATKGDDENLVKSGNTFPTTTTHKTKAQIVARLQEAEADAWLEIVSYDCNRAPISCTDRERLRWEESDPERMVLMAAWYSLRVLMEELEIHTAKNLPQHVAAKALSAELDSRRAMGSPGAAFTIKS